MTERTILKHSRPSAQGLPRKTWRETPTGIQVRCPKCDEATVLTDDYRIDPATGDVHPTFVCLDLQCDFEGPLRLQGYAE